MKRLLVLTVLWLAGCSPATTLPTAVEIPASETPSPTATDLPITPALFEGQPDHTFEGISLHAVGGGYTMHWRAEEESDGLPGHYQFYGKDAPMWGGVPSQILFLPTSAFPEEVVALRQVLADMPAHVEISDTTPGLPRLPRDAVTWFGLEQMLVSQIAYLRFQNGIGVRYITFYDRAPINTDRRLIYTFQGLTDDGQWYVSVINAITYPNLDTDGNNPPEGANINADYNMVSGDYRAYYQAMAEKIQVVSPEAFTPALPELDAMVRSMRIEPTLATALAATPLPPTPTAALPVVPAPSTESNTTIGKLTLYLDPDLADGWTVEEPRIDTYNPGSVMPRYLKITLTGFAGAPVEGIAQIYLMPTEVEDPLASEQFVKLVNHLRDFLQQRPATYSYGVNPTTGIPDLPSNDFDNGGAVQQFLAQIAYLDFQDGTGVRWVTEYTMERTPIVNDGLRYVYQGLTADGRYAVAAYFPIRHPSLVDTVEDVPGYMDDYSAFIANYNSYAPPIIEGLQRADPNSFAPSLPALDRLIQSIRVNP